MRIFVKPGEDIVRLWDSYAGLYLSGVWNTLSLAVLSTAVGCLIGFLCGILNTIPYTKNDSVFKRDMLSVIRIFNQIYVEVFRGTPMILQAVLIYYGLPTLPTTRFAFQAFGSLLFWSYPSTPAHIWRISSRRYYLH